MVYREIMLPKIQRFPAKFNHFQVILEVFPWDRSPLSTKNVRLAPLGGSMKHGKDYILSLFAIIPHHNLGDDFPDVY